MQMFNDLMRIVAEKIFKKYLPQSDTETSRTAEDAREYYNISEENLTALISNALAVLAFGDSGVSVSTEKNGPNKRSQFLDEFAGRVFDEVKHDIALALGTGMIASIPYVADGKIYFDTIGRDRFAVTASRGSDILQITALADIAVIRDRKYIRWTDYSVEGNVYVIKNAVTTETGKPVSFETVPQWANIEPEIRIANVDRLPVAFYKCPVSGRRPGGVVGVPITFGCGATLTKIKTTFAEIEREFEKKKVKIIAPRTLLKTEYDEKGNVIGAKFDDDLFVKTADTDENTIDIFDPSIRESAYFAKLTNHFAFLEKEIGISKGTLTDLTTNGATATEIRRSMHATFCFTDDMRKEYTKYFESLMYAADVLCNYYGLTPPGEYKINYEWNYSLVEDSTETWNQMKDGQSIGIRSKAELRAWQTGESIEDAQKAVENIAAKEPSLSSLLGMDEGADNHVATSTGMKNNIADNIDSTVTKQLNGAQTQSLINIVMQHKQGVLTEGQAISIISTSIGVSKEQATELLRA